MVGECTLLLMTLLLCIGECECNYSHHGGNSSNVSQAGPCNQSTSTRHILLAVFSVSVLIIGMVGNLISITVIQTSRQLRSQIAYLFVTSLAVADLGVSVFVTTVKVDMYRKNGSFCHGFELCLFFYITDSLFPMTSISHLLIIGIDRWYAIASPFTYMSNMTYVRAKVIIAAAWFYAMIWTFMGMFKWDGPAVMAFKITEVGRQRYCYSFNKYYHTTVVSVIYILPMSATTVLYAIVLHIAMKQAAAISKFNISKRKVRSKRLSSEAKAAKTVAVVFLAYIICWVPHIVIVIIQYWSPHVINTFYNTSPSTYDVVTTIISNVLPPINSCINPFIYFIFGAQFRAALKDLYCKLLKKPRHGLMYGEETGSTSRNRSLVGYNDEGGSCISRKDKDNDDIRINDLHGARSYSVSTCATRQNSIAVSNITNNMNGNYTISLL